jgi:hypothetical protein
VTGVQVWERVTRSAALGIRFWDVAAGSNDIDGLEVDVFPRSNPRARCRALPNRSGVYVAHAVRGLHDYEFGFVDPWAASPAQTAPYRIEVRDPEGRYLPMGFDADLPARGLLSWLAPWLSPPDTIALPTEAGSPAMTLRERIPLFSAPTRPAPDPFAVVYAQLAEDASPGSRPAAWCLLGVSIDGSMRGLGLSDREGRVAVIFPYPEPARRRLVSPPDVSPPVEHNDFTWEVELTPFLSAASPAREAPQIADLASVLRSLDTPGRATVSRTSPGLPLRLAYLQPLTVRTEGGTGADASYLFVSA